MIFTTIQKFFPIKARVLICFRIVPILWLLPMRLIVVSMVLEQRFLPTKENLLLDMVLQSTLQRPYANKRFIFRVKTFAPTPY